MPGNPKLFAQRLDQCLNDMDAPTNDRERALVLSKLLDIPRQQAWSLLEGYQLPEAALLTRIANEFEVDPYWLSGEK